MRFDTGDKTVDNWRRNGRVRTAETVERLHLIGTIGDQFSYMIKKGSDEVKEEGRSAEDWEQWRVADAEEWSKVQATEAAKVPVSGGVARGSSTSAGGGSEPEDAAFYHEEPVVHSS